MEQKRPELVRPVSFFLDDAVAHCPLSFVEDDGAACRAVDDAVYVGEYRVGCFVDFRCSVSENYVLPTPASGRFVGESETVLSINVSRDLPRVRLGAVLLRALP